MSGHGSVKGTQNRFINESLKFMELEEWIEIQFSFMWPVIIAINPIFEIFNETFTSHSFMKFKFYQTKIKNRSS